MIPLTRPRCLKDGAPSAQLNGLTYAEACENHSYSSQEDGCLGPEELDREKRNSMVGRVGVTSEK